MFRVLGEHAAQQSVPARSDGQVQQSGQRTGVLRFAWGQMPQGSRAPQGRALRPLRLGVCGQFEQPGDRVRFRCDGRATVREVVGEGRGVDRDALPVPGQQSSGDRRVQRDTSVCARPTGGGGRQSGTPAGHPACRVGNQHLSVDQLVEQTAAVGEAGSGHLGEQRQIVDADAVPHRDRGQQPGRRLTEGSDPAQEVVVLRQLDRLRRCPQAQPAAEGGQPATPAQVVEGAQHGTGVAEQRSQSRAQDVRYRLVEPRPRRAARQGLRDVVGQWSESDHLIGGGEQFGESPGVLRALLAGGQHQAPGAACRGEHRSGLRDRVRVVGQNRGASRTADPVEQAVQRGDHGRHPSGGVLPRRVAQPGQGAERFGRPGVLEPLELFAYRAHQGCQGERVVVAAVRAGRCIQPHRQNAHTGQPQ